MPKWLLGSLVGTAAALALGAAMVPLRSHISIATSALVMVVPVVAGVVSGGLLAGVVTVAAGFLVYDYAFIPPYHTLTVGAAQNWVALIVYVVVMLMVAQVVARLGRARVEAEHTAQLNRRLYEMSDLVVNDRPLGELLASIVAAARSGFDMPGVALLLPEDGALTNVASAGDPIPSEELRLLDSGWGKPVSLATSGSAPSLVQTVALAASGGPVGVLAFKGVALSPDDRKLLAAFANHAALAIERARLREEALQAELLREVDSLRRTLLGAVSHDLRTPLASMKIASTALRDPTLSLSDSATDELYDIIDTQTDRLSRLVTSLLDMTRLQAGVLQVQRDAWPVADLLRDALLGLRGSIDGRRITVDEADDLPAVQADPILIGQVITNLVENANRQAPPDTAIEISARPSGDQIIISVSDHGPGVPPQERDTIFDRFVRFDSGGRSGLGLAIAKTFVEAHCGRIWVQDVPGGGACFAFTLDIVSEPEPEG